MSSPLLINRWLFNNNSVVGAVIKSKLNSASGVQVVTATIPQDDTIPTSSEGTELTDLVTTYVPKRVGNRLRVTVRLYFASNGVDSVFSALFRNSESDAIAVSGAHTAGLDRAASLVYRYEQTIGSLSGLTFRVRLGPSSATPGSVSLNGLAGVRVFGGKATSSVLIEEIQA